MREAAMFELEHIFAYDLTSAVYLYATAALVILYGVAGAVIGSMHANRGLPRGEFFHRDFRQAA